MFYVVMLNNSFVNLTVLLYNLYQNQNKNLLISNNTISPTLFKIFLKQALIVRKRKSEDLIERSQNPLHVMLR